MTFHRWCISVCCPPLGRPLTSGMLLCPPPTMPLLCTLLLLGAGEGAARGIEFVMLAVIGEGVAPEEV